MQAIILAAGMGKRLKELTSDNTKCMVKVNGITMIERMLRQLDALNLSSIVIVIGYQGKLLSDYIATLNIHTPIIYVDNAIYDKTNNIYSLYLARNYLIKEDTLLLESDLIFDDAVLKKIIKDPYPSLALVAKYESWMDGTVVVLNEENNMIEFLGKKKFKFEEIKNYYKTVNIYKFSKNFSTTHYVPFLEAYTKALGDNEYYEQILKVITSLEKPEIKANFERLITGYPSGMEINSLLAAKYFGLKKEQVVVGNGAAELIKSLMERRSAKIGLVLPTFEEYPNRIAEESIIAFYPKNNDYSYTTKELMRFFEDKKITTLLLINPDNPSGHYIKKEEVIHLAKWTHEQGITFVVDESFVDFIDIEKEGSILSEEILSEYPNLIVIKSISKSFGVPGLRLGILASDNKDIIHEIKKDVAIWNINSFAEFYLQIFEKYKDDYEDAILKFKKVRKEYEENLSKIKNIRVIPSQANYFLCEVLGEQTAKILVEILLDEYQIFIKDLSIKKGFDGEYIRLAVKTQKENRRIIEAIKAVLNEA